MYKLICTECNNRNKLCSDIDLLTLLKHDLEMHVASSRCLLL